MSQADPTDTGPSAENTSPPAHPHHTDPDSSQDVPAALAPPSAPQQPSLITESLNLPQSTEEMTEDTTALTNASEGQTDQAEPAAEAQVIECDQPVSLEPDTEAAEDDVEVCSSSSFSTVSSFDYILLTYNAYYNLQFWIFQDNSDIS